jgi:hypothetical protein
MEFLCSENSVDEALLRLLLIFENGSKEILITNTGASEIEFNKLSKLINKYFFMSKAQNSLIVHCLNFRGWKIIQ